MWEPFGRIEELKFDLKEDLEIYINYLKIRKKTINEMIPKIDNLHFVDLEEIRTFKTAKRTEEHASGRFLLCHMLKKYFPHLDHKFIEVYRDEHRAPYFRSKMGKYKHKRLPNFSISTSGDYVVVALCEPKYSVGVDIEKLNQNRTNSLFDFISEGDELIQIKSLYQKNGNHELNHVWTAKESILKSLKIGFSISPTKIKVINENFEFKEIVRYAGTDLFLRTSVLNFNEDYSFSIALTDSKNIEFEKMRIAGIEPTT
ncbi:MAG: hypothetical protein CMB64_03260 [Euryarchaeota archaeon]|nr:hypothetical protein [Euryarchaeota archaeon]